ncbi:erythroid membrane-associated protein isoform X1 [Artibeus jamaicensis]|uniref:erythroid membrane-associated protein isoform X1 n=1 Tax=Artibeus jamaicensis TaxID=9417 RepID=UPI00235AB887|nr:erythroid membrane-associated protein isoform X1 [Artibeus jamaicensis]
METASSPWLSGCLLALVFLQLPAHLSGDSDRLHLAPLGGTARLLCPLTLWSFEDVTEVRWLRTPTPGPAQVVHVFRDAGDRLEDVVAGYKGRTALLRDGRLGNVSLEIRAVRLEDRGPYRCRVQIGNLSREGTVNLQVAVLGSDPYIHVKGFDAGWIQLVCRSVGWFPRPRAEWRDPQGKALPSETETSSLDQAGLFETAISSKVKDSTVGNVSCAIRNVALGQEKSAAMVVAAPSPGRISSSEVALAVILPVLGLLIVVGVCFLWKQRRSREKLLYEQAMEVENLLSDHAREKGRLHKALKKLRSELKLKRAAADSGWRRARLHFVAVTLDPDTAHPKLILSEDRRCVKLGDRRQPVLDNPQRFDFVVSVLGSEYFVAGCHYWEVNVGDKTKWILGVCSESVSRKGKVTASPANGHWLMRQSRGNQYEALTSPQTSFRLKEPPRCVGIFLDYEAGIISFYNVTDKSHIFTFTHTFSGPLRPFFEPCLHDEGKNTAPLIVCSELQKSEESIVPKPDGKGHANGDVALRVDSSLLPPQAPELSPHRDLTLPWPPDVGPALQGLKVPYF